ncbi:hypothetical protein Tco_0589308 [Tanacetum coccineum]
MVRKPNRYEIASGLKMFSGFISLFSVECTKGLHCFQEEEIVALLKSEEDAKDKKIQTDISDEDLERVLDRSDLIATGPVKAKIKPVYLVSKLPLNGPGWEVVIPSATGGMLSTINN